MPHLFALCSVAAVLCAGATAARISVNSYNGVAGFAAFKAAHGKVYVSDAEHAKRAAIFAYNVAAVHRHNAAGSASFTLGVNQFSDLTPDEFQDLLETRIPPAAPLPLPGAAANASFSAAPQEWDQEVPDSIDWRTKGMVPPVVDEGQMGSAVVAATIASIESCVAIATGQAPPHLSTAQATGCSGICDDPVALASVFVYVKKNGGLASEANYPASSKNVCKCNHAAEKRVSGTMMGYDALAPMSEAKLAAAVAAGPTTAVVEADKMAWQSYRSGVITRGCGTKLNHQVLVVGYTPTYWIVQNSWGASWGDEGYILVGKGTGANAGAGVCGINLSPIRPTGCGSK